jgi:hypothetical protein
MKPIYRFLLCQLVSLIAAVVFAVVLIPFCLRRAWTGGGISIKDGRAIDVWRYRWLQAIAGNPEDGVSGQTALVWGPNGLMHYMLDADPRWRAYCWSALRNSVNQLKYRFAWKDGPLWTWSWKVFSWTISGKAGWQMENGMNVLVCSPAKISRSP